MTHLLLTLIAVGLFVPAAALLTYGLHPPG
jgi:hypothetical protein